MLIVGDSLSTDVLLGINNGVDSCWFNPNNNQLLPNYKPTYIVNDYQQLKEIVKN